MLNKIIIFLLMVTISSCTYNPDAGKFVKFNPLAMSVSKTLLIDQVKFYGNQLNDLYKEIIVRQIKSDIANASNIRIIDYNDAFKQEALIEPDLIVNINVHINEISEELNYYQSVWFLESTRSTHISGKGKQIRSTSSSSSTRRQDVIKLPLNYGRFELTAEIKIYKRIDLSLTQSKSVSYLKFYGLDKGYHKGYPHYNNSFFLDNLHEISGLIVNGLIFSSKMIERKIDKSYGEIFLKNVQAGLIQKELLNLENKVSFTLDFKEKSVYLYYLGLIHEIIGQPFIAYDYYEKSIKHDGSNNLPHLAIGNIDRNRKL